MTTRSKNQILNTLIQVAWSFVALIGLVLVVIAGRGGELPVDQAIHFTTGLPPFVFLALVGWVLLVVGLGIAAWWYYEHFYSHTIYVRTPYGEIEIHRAAIRGYLEQQLGLLPEVVDYDVSVSIVKRRFLVLDIHVLLSHDKSCRDYSEKLQQDILQMLLSTFGVKDIRRFHLQVNAFTGKESQKMVVYR